MKTASVKQLLDQYSEVVPGFNALRLILASIILLYHAFIIQTFSIYHSPYGTHEIWLKPVTRAFLPMFFFLGGFLVTGSALRVKSLKAFLAFRIFRIVPALLVEVVLSAVVLGGFFTTLPLEEYYRSPGFFAYFLNIVGDVHFFLPGVFMEGNSVTPTNGLVNGNLWTLPPDLLAYAILTALFALHIIFFRKTFFGLFVFASLVVVVIQVIRPHDMLNNYLLAIPLAGFMQIYSFFMGALVYLFSDRIFLNKRLLLLALVSLAFLSWEQTILLGVWAACYLCLYIGFMDLRNFPLVQRGDYSYGIYLYGYPILQACRNAFPILKTWEELFCIAMPVTLLFAILSWHIIEKPVLGLKGKIWPKLHRPHSPV